MAEQRHITCRGCGELIPITPFDPDNLWQVPYGTDDEDGTAVLYNGLYGCDSMCEYVRLRVQCYCSDWQDGQFGEFDNEKDWLKYLENLTSEYYSGRGGE